MNIFASAYGRLGQDPRSISRASGKPMAAATIAVDVSTQRDPHATHWLPLIAFSQQAESLLKHQSSDCIAVCGRLQRNVWTDKEGVEHIELQMVVDTLNSARTVRPGGKRACAKSAGVRDDYRALAQPAEDFNDAIQF